MVAFTLMSTGYFFTSISTAYGMVFLSLVLMAVGAGFLNQLFREPLPGLPTRKHHRLALVFITGEQPGGFLFSSAAGALPQKH